MNNKKLIKEIVLFILIAVYFASNIILREVSNLDELWNYNFASNMSNGLIPYRDFNMVVTPLLPLIGGIFLNLFGKELIVIRFLNILLNTSIVFMMYKIMKRLEIKEYINLLMLMILTYIFKDYAMFDYNFAISLVSLIIVYLEIKHYKNNNKSYQIFIGILAGICITLKQTTGLIISVTLLLYKVLDIKNKQDVNVFFKMLSWRAIGIIIPILIMVSYLIINNAFYEFIDYCILGVSTFSNKISYAKRLLGNSNLLVKALSVMPVILLAIIPIYIRKRDKNALILFSFGFARFKRSISNF